MGESGDTLNHTVGPNDRFRAPDDPRRADAEDKFGELNQPKEVNISVDLHTIERLDPLNPAEQQVLDDVLANLPKIDVNALTAEAQSRLLLDGCVTALMKTIFAGSAIYSAALAYGTLSQNGEPNRALFYSGLSLLSIIAHRIAQKGFEAQSNKVVEEVMGKLNQ